MEPKQFKRVVLKLSGEALAGEKGYGIDPAIVDSVAKQIKETVGNGLQVAVVVGGGNIWRGLSGSSRGMDRATADYMGMLATVINSLALQDALEQCEVDTRVQTAIEMRQVLCPESHPVPAIALAVACDDIRRVVSDGEAGTGRGNRPDSGRTD